MHFNYFSLCNSWILICRPPWIQMLFGVWDHCVSKYQSLIILINSYLALDSLKKLDLKILLFAEIIKRPQIFRLCYKIEAAICESHFAEVLLHWTGNDSKHCQLSIIVFLVTISQSLQKNLKNLLSGF